jgi:glutamate racemase
VKPARPIGVFDSGVGGLSVLREIRRELPALPVVYVADSGFAPYGDRDPDFILQRCDAIVRFLIAQSVSAIVIACNTATNVAVGTLRRRYALPIVAIEPAVKPAVSLTRSGVVGVLATSATLASEKFATLVHLHGAEVRVLVQPCPGLAHQVEAGQLDDPATRELVERYVRPLVEQGADTLVLGCTHYTFLAPLIQAVAGPEVSIIDPAAAVARELHRRLQAADLFPHGGIAGFADEAFWASGNIEPVSRVLGELWSSAVAVSPLPAEYQHVATTPARRSEAS